MPHEISELARYEVARRIPASSPCCRQQHAAATANSDRRTMPADGRLLVTKAEAADRLSVRQDDRAIGRTGELPQAQVRTPCTVPRSEREVCAGPEGGGDARTATRVEPR